MSEQLIPRVEPLRKFGEESKTGRSARLEDLLVREKAERDADADKMGELLARAIRAETEVVALNARVAELEGQLVRRNKHDSVPTVANARALAAELAKVLEKVASRDQATPPSSGDGTKPRRSTLEDLPAPKSARGGA